MISKIDRITGVGRYSDYRNQSDTRFSRYTIVFGQNTSGKSTLTDIFWSWKTGKPHYIQGRKTFGYNGIPQVDLQTDNGDIHAFPSEEWEKGNPSVEIFDTQFIHENIFEGNAITYDHQRNLHTVIIGVQGSTLAREIASIQEDMAALTAAKTAKTAEFNKTFNKEISAADFKKLPRVENAQDKIAALQSRIESTRNQDNILKAFEAVEVYLTNIINQDTRELLSQNLDVKLALVDNHITRTWKDANHSRDFLQTGLHLTRDGGDCVFCGQTHSASSNELLNAYRNLFSPAYSALQAKVNHAVSRFTKWNPLTHLDLMIEKLVAVKVPIEISSKEERKALEYWKTSADTTFEKKAKELDYVVSFEEYDAVIRFFTGFKRKVDALRTVYVHSSPVDADLLSMQLREIELSEQRHTQQWNDFFREYDEIDDVQEVKKSFREDKRQLLRRYSEQVFTLHLDTINKILKELDADFSITDFQPMNKLVGKTERIFSLEFFNKHRVSIQDNTEGTANFSNTLSESDKRVLAFAFFYSMMVHDPALDQKIIVFDDPFASFDTDRRIKAASLLINPHLITEQGELIDREVNQLIVLTHDTYFFEWLNSHLYEPTALRIESDGELNGVRKSRITEY